jgi:hypothetical protein
VGLIVLALFVGLVLGMGGLVVGFVWVTRWAENPDVGFLHQDGPKPDDQ